MTQKYTIKGILTYDKNSIVCEPEEDKLFLEGVSNGELPYHPIYNRFLSLKTLQYVE